MQSPIICLVTGGGTARALLSLVREAAAAGVSLIQIRERSLDDRALLALTREAVEATRDTGCRVVVNDRLDIAIASQAAGVHLRGESFPAGRVRAMAPRGFLVGQSVHGVDEAVAAAHSGCDYLVFGTVFPSRSKPDAHPVAGLGQLHKVSTAVQIPVIAIGGISLENAAATISAGASGVAAIDLFRSGPALAEIVSSLRRPFDT